ncbi:MAG: cadherin-like beta sandwich domain-containing protein [Coriobacteriia bacterium]|nr:cadherin-like beta sandwich domain-containing protein [Coriobacteriia bacterium]
MNARKTSLSILFVALLTIPALFGAVPLKIYTPRGTASLEVPVAEARARNTSNNRLRNLRVPTSNVSLNERFRPNRTTYRINVRQNVSRVQLQPTRDNSSQNVRHRIDTRRANGNWNNGSWSGWRQGSNFNNRINVRISQGQERRVRIAVRDANGNIRTYTVNLRRASGNTFASQLRMNAGTLNRSFSRSVQNYTLTLPANRASVNVRMNRDHANAQMRVRVHNGSWSSYSRANLNRTVNVPEGGQRVIRFQIRGAWTNLVASPTRTRTYTITINRPTAMQEATTMAQQFLNAHGHSRAALIEALVHRGISRAVATAAVDAMGINWNQQAVRLAQEILALGFGISRSSLIEEMIIFDGFTSEQATFGADNSGADWNQQAVLVAREIRMGAPWTNRATMIQLLTSFHGFTQAQAEHAANVLGLS